MTYIDEEIWILGSFESTGENTSLMFSLWELKNNNNNLVTFQIIKFNVFTTRLINNKYDFEKVCKISWDYLHYYIYILLIINKQSSDSSSVKHEFHYIREKEKFILKKKLDI